MIAKAPHLSVPRLKFENSALERSSDHRPVLVALDGSSAAERALPLALAVAQRWIAPLRLVHIRNPIEDDHKMDVCLIDNGQSLSVQSRAGAYLESLAESLSDSHNMSVDSVTVSGTRIADTLRTMCERNSPRLLVMGRSRRSSLSRWLSGSVTRRLMSNLTAPLLLVPADSWTDNRKVASLAELNRILVHLDGTDASEQVLDLASSMASDDTICHLRRVIPLSSLYTTGRSEFSRGSDIRGKAWLEMSRASKKLKRQGIKCTSRLIFDGQSVASTIVAQSKAVQAQVVVISAARQRLTSWFKTEVADYVLRYAGVPVLIVSPFSKVLPPIEVNHVDSYSN